MEAIKPAAEAKGDEEDFFSSWDKPATYSKTTPAASPKPTGPPVIGRSASAATAAPRTVSSSSLRSSSAGATARTNELGASRLGLTSTTPTLRPLRLASVLEVRRRKANLANSEQNGGRSS